VTVLLLQMWMSVSMMCHRVVTTLCVTTTSAPICASVAHSSTTGTTDAHVRYAHMSC